MGIGYPSTDCRANLKLAEWFPCDRPTSRVHRGQASATSSGKQAARYGLRAWHARALTWIRFISGRSERGEGALAAFAPHDAPVAGKMTTINLADRASRPKDPTHQRICDLGVSNSRLTLSLE